MQNNPYQPPDGDTQPTNSEPTTFPWVILFGTLGGVVGGGSASMGWIPQLSDVLPSTLGFGSAVTGAVAGVLVGRVVGRLLVARYRYRQIQIRHDELRQELEDHGTVKNAKTKA